MRFARAVVDTVHVLGDESGPRSQVFDAPRSEATRLLLLAQAEAA